MSDDNVITPPTVATFIIKRLLSENFNTEHLLTDIDVSNLAGEPLAVPNVDFAYNKDYQIIYKLPKDTSVGVTSAVSYLYLPPVTMPEPMPNPNV